MINSIMAMGIPGIIELFIVLILILIFIGIPIVIIIWILKLLTNQKNENIRLRLEVGKLADEIEQLRKQKDGEQDATTIKSV